jgi:protein involved in polysaccharide export with SLBB domain
MHLRLQLSSPVALCLAFLLGCGSAQQVPEIRKARDASEPAVAAIPAAASASGAGVADNYRVRANDKLSVRVFDEENLSGLCIVREDGTVRLPLINEVVRVGGLSLTDVENRIRALLAKDYVKEPRVTVNIAEMSKFKFTVMGQVNRAGAYEIGNNKRVSLLEAIGMAGGFTRLANEKEVYLKRVVGGQEKVFTLNAKEMARNPNGTVYLQEGDVVTIKEAGF